MAFGEKVRGASARTRVLFVAIFAFLLVLGTTVQVTHLHPNGAAHADCALCQSAHNVIRPAATPTVRTIFLVVRRVAPASTRPYREHVLSYSHWNRPPPDQAPVA